MPQSSRQPLREERNGLHQVHHRHLLRVPQRAHHAAPPAGCPRDPGHDTSDRAADPETWQTHWKPIYDTITEVVLPTFTPEQVKHARQQANLTPIDAGILNDMRGVPEAPAS